MPNDPGIHLAECNLRQGWWIGSWLFFVALLSHGPLLLNDGIYWDGWMVYWLRREQNWRAMVAWSKELGGLPLRLLQRWVLGSLPDTEAGFKIAVFLSFVICALLVYLLAHRVGRLGLWDSLFVALIGLVYPACQTSVEITCSMPRITFVFFLLATLLACMAERHKGLHHISLRIGSLISFTLSFCTNSFLVFYAGFFLLWMIDAARIKKLTLLDLVRDLLPKRLDYILLPVIYWWLARTLSPPSGLYAGYNPIRFSGAILTYGYRKFFENSVYAQWRVALWRMYTQPWVGMVAAVIAGAVFVLARGRAAFTRRSNCDHLLVLIYGLILLICGMFPYVVVGKPPSIEGWDSRHAILLALPVALIVVTLVGWCCAGRSRNAQAAGYAVLAVFVWLFTVSTWSYYARWQARWVKDKAIIAELQGFGEERRNSVFWIDDRMPVGPESSYAFYDWSGLFKSAWSDESHIGLDIKVYNEDFLRDGKRYFNERYMLSNFDPNGRQAQLIIWPGRAAGTEWRLVLQYWRFRFLEPDGLRDFLSHVVSITVQSLSQPIERRSMGYSPKKAFSSGKQK